MRDECINAVAGVLGRTPNSAEVRGIEQRIARHLREGGKADPAGWMALPMAEKLHKAAEGAAKELIAEAAKKKQRVALTILAHDRIQNHLNERTMAGVSGLDALKRMVAFHSDTKGNFLSVETQARTIERNALRQMVGLLEASNPKFFGLVESREGVAAITKELFGEVSGVKEAKDGAAVWKSVNEALRQRFNRAGGDIGKLEDWGLPHHHSQRLVAKAGREQWSGDLLGWINRERYLNEDGTRMSDNQLLDFLFPAWETIATGGANKQEPGRPAIGGMRANRGNESRQIHFKDAESYMAYQEKYGERPLYEVLTDHISAIAKDIALVETFGPNADLTYRFFREKAVRDAKMADPTRLGKIQEEAIKTDGLYNIVAGRSMPVASEWLANSFDTLRNWLIASRLGSAVISSLSDEATLHLTAHVNNLPFMQVLANELAALNPANQMEKRMALRAGLAMNTLIASLNNRFGQETLGASSSSKIASTVMRASGLNALTEARKRAFGVTMMSSLGQISKEFGNLKALDEYDHRILLSKGITDTDFAVWREAQLEDWGGGNNTMLTPDAIYRIPDDVLAKIAPSTNPQRLREQAATRLLGIVLEETDMAVIEPGAKERAITTGGLQRGTWKGELTRSFFLFKSFPIAMIARHWMRAMDMDTNLGKAAYIGTLVASTTILGAMAMQINEVLNGRDPRNLNPLEGGARNWIQAMLKGGSLGIYGDFLFSESTQYGQSPVASVLGPMIGLGESVFNLTQGNITQAILGKDTHAGAELVRFVKGNTPGASLWYAKAALDRIVFHQLQEHFSPGYLAKMRARSSREFGQSWWWEPGETAPDRAPDLAAMGG